MSKRNDFIISDKSRKSYKSGKKRTIIVASALSIVCVAAMAGIYSMEVADKAEEEPLVNWEDTASSDTSEKINIKMSDEETGVSNQAAKVEDDNNMIQDNFGADSQNLEKKFEEAAKELDEKENGDAQNIAEAQNAGGTASEIKGETATENEESVAQTSAKNSVALSFGQNDSLAWPVEGNVILDYSMDSTIYFPTLDQYKYNPAIVIQAEEGCSVKAAASGIVDSIEKSDETGLTVTMDIGGGYKLIYGQLKNVDYSTGTFIEKGESVGTIATPTKYYSIEGSNLFFKMLNNEVPTNPVDYLKDGVVVD